MVQTRTRRPRGSQALDREAELLGGDRGALADTPARKRDGARVRRGRLAALALARGDVLPHGRGGRDRNDAGRPRDIAANRGALGEIAGASQPRCSARSVDGGARGAGRGDHAEAVLAERRTLDDQVERRADLLSEPREHAFVKVRRPADGSADLLQLSLHRPALCRAMAAVVWRAMPQAFRHRLRVRFNECDPQGVVFYANYLMYVDVAMTELWREAAGGYDAMVASGTDVMVAEAQLRYRESARFDDELDVLIRVTRLGTTSVVFGFALERAADGALLVEGELRQVFVDGSTYEKRDIPERIREGLEGYRVEEPEQVGR